MQVVAHCPWTILFKFLRGHFSMTLSFFLKKKIEKVRRYITSFPPIHLYFIFVIHRPSRKRSRVQRKWSVFRTPWPNCWMRLEPERDKKSTRCGNSVIITLPGGTIYFRRGRGRTNNSEFKWRLHNS